MNIKPETTQTAPKPAKVASYVKGSHAAGVRSDHDAQRTELLALRDVLSAHRDCLSDQIDDIGETLGLLSEPGVAAASEAWRSPVALAAE